MMNNNKDLFLNITEGLKVEMKRAKNGLPKSLWETYSAFANTSGGTIYLGIEENTPNNIVGVSDPIEIKKDFFTTINNTNKVNKNILKEEDFKIIKVDDNKSIITINVPEANVYDKPIYLNGSIMNTYKRTFEGDFKLNQLELLAMIDDAKVISYDSLNNKLNIGFDLVDINTLELFRDELNKATPNNIFTNDDNKEFLIKTGFLNEVNEKYILTNAGILLFTNPATIKRINPNYFLDYQEKINEDDEEWINRITTDDIDYVGNLYNFYNKVLERLLNDLPKPFYLDGIKDMGEQNIRFMIREAFLNAITNCNFNIGTSLKIIKTKTKIIFTNSGRLKIPYNEAIKYGNSDPRNKSLMTTFKILKVCDRGGNGLPRIFKISEELKYYKPLLIDDSVNNKTTLIIYLKVDTNKEKDKVQSILSYLELNNDFISIADLSVAININRTTVSNIVNTLIEDGILITNGLATKGKKIKLKINK